MYFRSWIHFHVKCLLEMGQIPATAITGVQRNQAATHFAFKFHALVQRSLSRGPVHFLQLGAVASGKGCVNQFGRFHGEKGGPAAGEPQNPFPDPGHKVPEVRDETTRSGLPGRIVNFYFYFLVCGEGVPEPRSAGENQAGGPMAQWPKDHFTVLLLGFPVHSATSQSKNMSIEPEGLWQ